MTVGHWLRPPRHLVVLFLGITLILVSTLAWLGWRLFQQDRSLERQRVQVRLEHAADVVAAEMDRMLRSIEGQLTRLSTVPPRDLADSAEQLAQRFPSNTVTLVLKGGDVAAYPNGRLLYYPTPSTAQEPDESNFAPGETLEYRPRDLAGAARVYRRTAQTGDSAVRAGALLRLARTERKAGQFNAALDAYHALATLGSIPTGGLPAELVAGHARLAILHTVGRSAELRSEAAALHADLAAGRWRLTRAQFEFHQGEVCRWTDCAGDSGSTKMSADRALAAGAEWVWSRRRTLARNGRELSWLDGQPVLAVWQGSTERTAALVGGSAHLAADWIGGLEPMLRRLNVRVALSDLGGNRLTTPVGSGRGTRITRAASETRLPWTLQVASADPVADFSELAQRRRLMLLGLATIALLVLVGLYAVVRGVGRELEVAQRQSDFVAAVSHEFRTPLTSLRQLAELLSSGRVASEERRGRYYEVMARESGRLHRLVEGLLDFGRMEAGALEFTLERVELGELVRSVVAEFEAVVAESGYRVDLTTAATATTVRADPEALGRAVWNLLDNAVKYSPDHKTVWVKVSHADGNVAIAVRDEGVGIPAAQREAIFRKFIRGSAAGALGAKGTGIGLAMVKHIVEAHGAEVRVDSDVGRGSTFTIQLPVEA